MDDNILTRGGVAYDFDYSPYRQLIRYGSISELTYIFSSELNKQRFNDRLEENRNKINESLSKRFGFKIINNKLCDIKLYSTIEKRGFLIKGKEEYRCLNTIELDGLNLTIKN